MTNAELKAKALEEVKKIENAAVAEYLKLKVESFTFNKVLVISGAAFLVGAFLGHIL